MHLHDLDKAVAKSGLKVRKIPGWKHRGRPSYTGGFNPKGVLCHHTGGSSNRAGYVRWMALTGRSDLPAPLCQIALNRQGVVYVCAAGRANHAGRSDGAGFTYAGDGNAQLVGIEAMNTGSEGWTDAQYDAYVRLCAALCDYYNWPRSHVLGHKETSTTGKWDPGGIDMDDFRRDVRRVNLTKTKDWFDMASLKDLRAELRRYGNAPRLRKIVRQGVPQARVKASWEKDGKKRNYTVSRWIQILAVRSVNIQRRIVNVREDHARMEANVDARFDRLEKKIDALGGK